jgi:hypothetical protein
MGLDYETPLSGAVAERALNRILLLHTAESVVKPSPHKPSPIAGGGWVKALTSGIKIA